MASNISDHLRPTSPSDSTLSKTHSVRSHHTQSTPSALRKIVTSPPWARDEPPSPTETHLPFSQSVNSINPRPSQSGLSTNDDSAASSSNHPTSRMYGQKDDPLWWMFTRRGREEGPPPQRNLSESKQNWSSMINSRSFGVGGFNTSSNSNNNNSSSSNNEKGDREKPVKERSRSNWLSSAQLLRRPDPIQGDPDPDYDDEVSEAHRRSWGFHIPLPTPAPITISQNRTPGWDTPWTPRTGQPLNSFSELRDNSPTGEGEDQATGGDCKRTKWYWRRKRIRAFILNNNYVPLLFRVINITFTTAALAMAITIRKIERHYSITGAVGSSVTLVIIFAPLTLLHVMVAIYLEYFGRPLGLWRTSMKLAHTLSETLFICAWSAALALCFDNYFTSVVQCVPLTAISWYNEIPRVIPDYPNLGRGEGQPGDQICDRQMALISLVFVGLTMYCANLCISLFRIFEKVKYHLHSLPR